MHFTRSGLDRLEGRRECKTIHNSKKTIVLTNKRERIIFVKDPFQPAKGLKFLL